MSRLLFGIGMLGLRNWNAKATASARSVANNIVVSNTRDELPAPIGSLRRAIEQTASPGDTITFNIPTSDPGYDSTTGVFTIKLTRGSINFYKSLTINGPGANKLTISAEGQGRAFFISNSSFRAAESS